MSFNSIPKYLGVFILLMVVLLSQNLIAQQKVWNLEECITYALENNIQVQQNEISQEIANENLKGSIYGVLPSLNGFASNVYNFGQTIDPFTNSFATSQVRSNSFSLSSSFTVFDGFQNINSIKRDQALLEASKYDLDRIKNDISLNIVNAYLQILFNQELLKNADNQLRVTSIQIDRIDKQVEAGSLPEGALRDIEAQYSTEELQKINAQNQLGLSQLNLAQLLRLENADDFDIVYPDLSSFQGVADLLSTSALYSTAVELMPEVKSAEYNLYSAEISKRLSRGSYMPTLTLRGSIGTGFSGASREVTGFNNLGFFPNGDITTSGDTVLSFFRSAITQDKQFGDQLQGNFNKSVGLNLNIPLFNGMAVRTNVQRAKLQLQSAELNLENTKLVLRQNIESAHNDAVAALKRYRAAEKSLSALKTSFKYTQERFNVGLLNSFEFNTEKNRLNNAESELLQAKFNYIFSTKVLDFYQGKPITFSN